MRDSEEPAPLVDSFIYVHYPMKATRGKAPHGGIPAPSPPSRRLAPCAPGRRHNRLPSEDDPGPCSPRLGAPDSDRHARRVERLCSRRLRAAVLPRRRRTAPSALRLGVCAARLARRCGS
ncbi:hypothetical protein HMPREF0972_02222 [Actinomyces sp. oral taxon 848 str. F0332]|nr:hypothetical protein HMPREF0972_02222 [Actinomyces sp. oral taxon 848 str. F0332]